MRAVCGLLVWVYWFCFIKAQATPTTGCPEFVPANQNVRCFCYAHKNMQGRGVTVTWLGRSPHALLSLTNVQRADNGSSYTCKVSNAAGRTSYTRYTLRVAFGPSNEHLTLGPADLITNGSQSFSLTCNATDVYPTPKYQWSGITCDNGTADNVCVFTPDPTTDDLNDVTCTAVGSYGDGMYWQNPQQASKTIQLNLLYPPPGKPIIHHQATDHQVFCPEDTLTCTVTGGKPRVDSVHFSCVNPHLSDQHDMTNNTSVSSSVTMYATVGINNKQVTCFCNATWDTNPEYYTLFTTAVYTSGGSPRKYFNKTLHMTDEGIVFTLDDCSPPDTFVFTVLGKTVSRQQFSSRCHRDAKFGSLQNCLIEPLDVPVQLLGSYTVTVSNSVDINFYVADEDKAMVTSLTLNSTNETVTVNGDDRVNLNLNCTVSGRPIPRDVTITHGYTPLDNREIQYQRIGNGTLQAVLTLTTVRCHHMGIYTCTATNGIVGPDSKNIRLNVICLPIKHFHKALIMEEGRMPFRLAAYPVPDRFVFLQLGSQTPGQARDVSDSFTAECKQDPVTEFIVNCDVSLRQVSHNLSGHCRAEVFNRVGKVDIDFKIREGKGDTSTKPGAILWVTVGVAVLVVTVIVVVVVLRCWRRASQRPDSAEDDSSDQYEEIDEHSVIHYLQPPPLPSPRHNMSAPQSADAGRAPLSSVSVEQAQPLLTDPLPDPDYDVNTVTEGRMSTPPHDRPRPQLPDAGIPISIITQHEQSPSHSEPLQDRPSPFSSDARGATASSDLQPAVQQPEEIEMRPLSAMPPYENAYTPLQTARSSDNFMYSRLDTP